MPPGNDGGAPDDPAAQSLVVDARGFQVGDVDVPVHVVGHLAGHEGGSAELAGGDHGVAGAAAAGMAGFHQVAFEMAQQQGLTVLVDQGHHPFLHAHLVELAVFHLDFGVDQCGTDAISDVSFHLVGVSMRSAGYYPDQAGK